MWIEREICAKVVQVLKQRPSLVLTGARQTGKSSLLKNLLPDYAYVALDRPEYAESAEQNPDQFLNQYQDIKGVIIDEVQNAPQIFNYLKERIDNQRNKKGQFILTGLQKFNLMKGVTESLAGRIANLQLLPLSASELRNAGLPISIHRGFYPELHVEKEISTADYYRDYIVTYLERDVRSQLKIQDLRSFDRFIRACASRSGGLLNKNDIARDVGVSVPTITQWLSVLIASDIVFLLEPYHENRDKRWVKTPKLYFSDTGLLCELLKVSEKDAETGHFHGMIFETFVVSEYRKQIANGLIDADLFFLRDKYGKEVDLMLHTSDEVKLVEVKAKSKITGDDLASMNHFIPFLNKKTISKSVACKTLQTYFVGENVTCENLLLQTPRFRVDQ